MSHNSDNSPTPMAEQQEQSPIRPSLTIINREESSSEDEPAERITSERDMSPDNEGKDQAVDTLVNEDNLASSTMTKPSIIKLGKRKRADHNTDKPVNTEFAKRTLQRANFLSSSPEPEEPAGALRGGDGKTAPHKESVMRASPKPTCTLCEERGIDCTPHPQLPEKWRCRQCSGANIPLLLCKMKASNSSPAPDNIKLATPSSTSQAGLNALSNRNPRTTTNPAKAAHTKTKISDTHAPKKPPNPAKAQIPLLNSVISLANPAATEIKFLAEKYQANFNNIGDLETHEFRSMSRLLWLTHLELKDRLREVQGLEREVQGLKREREDWRRERKKIMRALGRMSEIGGNSPAGSAEGDDEIATQEK